MNNVDLCMTAYQKKEFGPGLIVSDKGLQL